MHDFWTAAWYQGRWWLFLFLPVSWLFRAIATWRRQRLSARAESLPVAVVVVGNISLGGTGKTPLLISLVEALRQQGLKPGVISRGYGGRAPHYPFHVTADSLPQQSGDEPLLIAIEAGCPVVVGPDRQTAASSLLQSYDCDVILSDDGLQHYALARDIELCVVDGQRGLGNGMCLPAGPLREGPQRLVEVDWVIVNGEARKPLETANPQQIVNMQLQPASWRSVDGQQQLPITAFTDRETDAEPLQAISGIGNPQRFFDTLNELGVAAKVRAFADHHAYSEADLAYVGDSSLLMTTKDAVKCRAFARPNWWSLCVDAQLPESFVAQLVGQIKTVNESKR